MKRYTRLAPSAERGEKKQMVAKAPASGLPSGRHIYVKIPESSVSGDKGDDLTGLRFGALTVVARKSTKTYLCRCDCGNEDTVSASDLIRGHNRSCGCKRKCHRGKDLVGLRVGKLTVVEITNEQRRGAYLWRCRCDCGREVLVEAYRLTGAKIQSCGCERAARFSKDLSGQRFGRLVAERRLDEKRNDAYLWLCRCDCGKTTKISTKALLSGNTKSCGCAKKEAIKKTIATHGTIADRNHFVDGTCIELIQRKKLNANNTSGYTGVQKRPNNRWAAVLTFQGKVHYLGVFDNKEDAIEARREAEKKYFDPFLEDYYKNLR